MILKGSQRAGAGQLARHLLRGDENDHVTVHELRGVAAETLTGALQEMRAVAAGTRCKQFMFTLSLNPPETETVSTRVFEQAVDRIEARLGLAGQPRAIVFHEKEGRRHAHCVWSRIDVAEMKAINLPHFKTRLREVSKELYLEHGWRMPPGLMDSRAKDPTTFTREEWQQAQRAGRDPKALKALFGECWAAAKDGAGLTALLRERGFWLARGDRRGVVAVDYRGEVYALAKWTGLKAREVKGRLGDPAALPSVAARRKEIAEHMTPVLGGYIEEVEQAGKVQLATLTLKKAQLKERQRAERHELQEAQAVRWQRESRRRAARYRQGFKGLWDRLTGKHREITQLNAQEAETARRRDFDERERLIQRQLQTRRDLQKDVRAARQKHAGTRARLDADIAHYLALGHTKCLEPGSGTANRRDARPARSQEPSRGRHTTGHDRTLDR